MNNSLFQEEGTYIDQCILNGTDSAWVGISSVLTMVMSPAVGFVYAGLVSAGAIGSMLGMCFAIFSMVTIIWIVIGYTLVYGRSIGGMIGDMTYIGLSHLLKFENKCIGQYGKNYCAKNHPYWESCGIPEFLILFFQAKFAAITPVLFLGSISERMIFKYTLFFILVWTILIYCPVAHWVWNAEGFINRLGARDYAGGIVVHITSGYAALITSIVLGKRKTYGKVPEISNFPYVILGTMILWFGWFGFNGGSSFSFNRTAIIALINTNISASTSVLTWLIIDLIAYKRFTALGLAMGSISGLVAITLLE
jgi:ammonium transporter, Amt family